MGIAGSSDPLPNFSEYRHLKGRDLKNGEYVGAADTRGAYSSSDFILIQREGNRVELGFCCEYRCARSLNGTMLRDFLPVFTRRLQATGWVHLDGPIVHAAQSEASLTVSAQFSASTRLGSAYNKLSSLLNATHANALDELGEQTRSQYLLPRRRQLRPDAFICHDSGDKQRFVRPIAESLSRLGCIVWYDERSLCVGDRLRESIECGLKRTRKCILVLTPRFLRNSGWTKTEFSSVFARELLHGKNVILPVWAGVTRDEVFEYCPSLVDRVGVHWKLGVDDVARQLYRAIRGRGASA